VGHRPSSYDVGRYMPGTVAPLTEVQQEIAGIYRQSYC
jgi:hypothetical protein